MVVQVGVNRNPLCFHPCGGIFVLSESTPPGGNRVLGGYVFVYCTYNITPGETQYCFVPLTVPGGEIKPKTTARTRNSMR